MVSYTHIFILRIFMNKKMGNVVESNVMSFRISVVFVETLSCKMCLAFANTTNQCMVIAN